MTQGLLQRTILYSRFYRQLILTPLIHLLQADCHGLRPEDLGRHNDRPWRGRVESKPAASLPQA